MFLEKMTSNLLRRQCQIQFSNLLVHEENTKENHKRVVFWYRGKERPQIEPTLTSIFSINTGSFEKLYKELEIVLYQSQNTSKLLKKLGYGLVFQHTSRCFDTVVKNAFSFCIYYIKKVVVLPMCVVSCPWFLFQS